MDSWTLQGDSYSFLRSAPRTFSLCHRDGTPNHVEIYDIINVPTQRSAISETTCLCDIFGDDCESHSLSSSPAAGAFVLSQRVVESTAAVSPPVDDLNDSSGSYHTAEGSSEGEEGFEDSRERGHNPAQQNESSERRRLEGKGLSSEHPQVCEDSTTNLESKNKSPVLPLDKITPSSEVLTSGERTPSPGRNSLNTLEPEGRLSSLSSSSAENRFLPSSSDPKQTNSETEPSRITPSIKDRRSGPSNQSLSPSPTLQKDLLNPGASHLNQNSSPSPELAHFSHNFTESAFESRSIFSSPLPSPSDLEIEFQSGVVSSELRHSSPSPHPQATSPFLELSGRVSLHDLLSRGSTPDIKDCAHTPVLISDRLSAGRDTTTTPESQDTRLSSEPQSTFSTPSPRYTPPSPVISIATSPEPVESAASPELTNTSASPVLLSPVSPANTGTRSPSPDPSTEIRNSLTFDEIKTQASSLVINYSLSPSPGERDNSVPTDQRYTSPSPEIRIIASSPEVSRKEQSPEVKTASASPLLEPHFDSASPRSFTSSPHITGISYSVVQPEDRDSTPFPELSCLSTPEPDSTLMSCEASRDCITSSVAESTDTPQDSPHISGFPSSIPQSETTLLPQPRYQTLSPHLINFTPSPEPRYQTLSSDEHQSPSPMHRSRDPSPVASIPGQRYQLSPVTLSTEFNPLYTPPNSSVRNTPVVEADLFSGDITETQSPTHLAEVSVSPTLESQSREKPVVAKLQSYSLAEADHSPISVLSDKSLDSSVIQQATEREETLKEEYLQDKSSETSFTEEKEGIHSFFIQGEDTYSNFPGEIKSPSPYLIAHEHKSPNISPVHRATSKQPVQTQENLHPQSTSYPLTSVSGISSPTSTCTPEKSRRQPLTKVKRGNRDTLTEDMSKHKNRRQTPSPPLTRFTPVHIIAPEKPYRQWQNRSRSPSQVLASSRSGNLKKAATNRESPNVDPVDNNSQPHQVKPGRQLEMEREIPLEQKKDVGIERQREMEREREREEQDPERGEGWQGVTSYRGEQVELSFSARNRKGPASCSAAPTDRETRQGLPAAHSYSDSLLATRQLQQQQSVLKRASQQDNRSGSTSRRLKQPTTQNKRSAPGRGAANRPCQSSSSSMGSELDETDNEVKWFTDLAFRSLSSPEVDYLDMYNSSHRSSTNISQASPQESPAGINAAWLAYADFRGSAPKLDHDEVSFQQPSLYYSDGLDPSRRYELGSFECIDVALEREDSRKVRKGVPKRQIQLKRKNNGEGKQGESSENSSPGLPVMVESPSQESHPRGTFVRQHSTPAAIQEFHPSECSPESNKQNERQSKLKKSASMDETCSKTKMASCLIKSVLSKKMQSVDRQPDEQAGEGRSPPTENIVVPLKESLKSDSYNLSSSLQSDYSVSSEGLPMRGESGTKDEAKLPKSLGIRTGNRPSSSSSIRSVTFSQTDSDEADSQSRNATSLKSEMKSELKVPFDSKHPRTGLQHSKTHKREGGESANTPSPSANEANNTQARVTNRDQECENTEDHKQLLQGDQGAYTSKTQEITLKATEKKKASLNVCLTPEAESKPGAFSPDVSDREKEAKTVTDTDEKTEEDHENDRVKAPIHKVRDVRRLVKNTYNLSFKAASAVMPSNVNEERMDTLNKEKRDEPTAKGVTDVMQEIRRKEERLEREEELWTERKEEPKEEAQDSKMPTMSPTKSKGNFPSGPQPMQIEYKAVCWKDNKNKMSTIRKDVGDKPQDFLKSVTEGNMESQSLKAITSDHTTGNTATQELCEHDTNISAETKEIVTEIHKVPDGEDKPVVTRTDRKPPMLGGLPKQPSKEREVSTAVVLIRERPNKTNMSATSAPEEIPAPIQIPVPASLSPGPTPPGNAPGSGHSVSMLLKEKGYQADIGAVVANTQNIAAGKEVPRKHVNSLEIPLQTTPTSDGGLIESHRERMLSSSGPSAVTNNTDILTKPKEDEGVSIRPPGKENAKQKRNSHDQTPPLSKQKDNGDFEAVKRLDPTFPPRSPAIRRFKPQPIEVKSLSKEPMKQDMPTEYTGNHRPQTIEVKSIAKNSQKPAVPPKPSCKFKPADLEVVPSETQRASAMSSTGKPQGEERPQTIVVSSPTIYRKISGESASTSNYSRKLAVSAVSSLKPPPHKTATTISSLSNQPAASSETEAFSDRGQQQQPAASPQSSTYAQNPASQATSSATGLGETSASGPVSDKKPNHIPGPTPAGARQPALTDQDIQMQYPRAMYPHEQAMLFTSNNAKQPTVSTSKLQRYPNQSCHRSLSSERTQRTDELHFYASDDPPSYDERESFSPLLLPDLTPVRQNRHQPTSRPPPCSCSAGYPSHSVPIPPHHHRSPHNLTPPAPPHSPGQALPYSMTQAPLRPHQCRPEPQPMSYQPGSPKSSPLGPNQPPSMYQPLHQSAPCPPHPSLMQACPVDRPLQPAQHTDSRRPPIHRSPHQQPPSIAGAPYTDPHHSHSPGLPPMDPQYMCGPQNMGPSYGSEYGGDSASLYSESSYGQTPRRVLLDPETGKYFYIEVPVQPLRKMLFDPETGQYVEVLIPQQAMSHSGLYPPSAAPFPPLHNPNMYAPAPQYMPCAAPPPLAHPQAQPQPPRYPDASAAAAIHPSGPGVSYRNPSGQGSKPEHQNHPTLDHSYLESMYYVPTGMNASPNPTPPDYYHKHPPHLPPTGGKRS
ncbi:uncharacterized protein [Leuresthes tenuis]|uniref:uncharacterized protein n=1 Tax=Leuresthes tenuis TaxID=355514 RepID=UPI003B511F13